MNAEAPAERALQPPELHRREQREQRAPPAPRSTAATAWCARAPLNAVALLRLQPDLLQRAARAVGARQGAGPGQHQRSRGDRRARAARRVLVFGRNFFSPRETTIKRFQVADTVTCIRGRPRLQGGLRPQLRPASSTSSPATSAAATRSTPWPASAAGMPNGSGETYQQAFAGPGHHGAGDAPRPRRSTRVFVQDEWKAAQGPHPELRPALRPPGLRAARGAQPRRAARRGRHRHQLHPDGQEQLRARAWASPGRPNAQTVVRAGYGLFYGRTPSIMVGTAHSGQRASTCRPITFTGRPVPTLPGASSPPSPTGAAAAAAVIFSSSTPTSRTPRCTRRAPASSARSATTSRSAASYLFVAGRNLQRSRDFNVGRPGAHRRSRSRAAAASPSTGSRRARSRTSTAWSRFESTAESTYNGAHPRAAEALPRAGCWRNLAYTLGKVEDTKPDAVNVVPGRRRRRALPVATRPTSTPTARPATTTCAIALVFSGYWDVGYFKDSGGAGQGAARRLVAELDRDRLQSGLPVLASWSTNDLNNDGNRSNDIVPGSRNAHRLPWTKNIDARLSRAIPLGRQAQAGADRGGLQPAQQHEHQRPAAARSTTSRTACWCPSTNLANPRLDFGADSSTQVNFEDTQRIVQLAAKVTF